jgi:hypothetical protein
VNKYEPKESHDQNFKNIIVENPRDAITFALPASSDYFQHEPEIIPIREETLKTFLSDSFLETDVPLLVKFDKIGFIFLIEHKHDPYSFSIYHLDRYVGFLQDQYDCDVIPIVYFPKASARMRKLKREIKSEFMGKRYHYFTYEAVFLKDMLAENYLESPNIIARLMLPFMRYSKAKLFEVLDSAISGVFAFVDSTKGLRQGKYLDFLFQYFKLGKKEWEMYRAYKQTQSQEEVEKVKVISTILKEEGWQEGWEKGKVQEGQDLLLRLLPKKLGPIPPGIERTIRALTNLERIHAIVEDLLEIDDWQELERLLNGKEQ